MQTFGGYLAKTIFREGVHSLEIILANPDRQQVRPYTKPLIGCVLIFYHSNQSTSHHLITSKPSIVTFLLISNVQYVTLFWATSGSKKHWWRISDSREFSLHSSTIVLEESELVGVRGGQTYPVLTCRTSLCSTF